MRLRRSATSLRLRSNAITVCLPGGLTSNSTRQVTSASSLQASCRWVFITTFTQSCSPLGMATRCGLQLVRGLMSFWSSWTRRPRKFASAPGPFGDRGDTPRWGPMAGTAACCTQYIRCCPLFPVQSQSAELPATTEGEWQRRHSLQEHEAGLLTVLSTSRHQTLL